MCCVTFNGDNIKIRLLGTRAWPILDPAALGAGAAVGDAPRWQAVVEATSRGARGGEGTRHQPSATGIRFIRAVHLGVTAGHVAQAEPQHLALCHGRPVSYLSYLSYLSFNGGGGNSVTPAARVYRRRERVYRRRWSPSLPPPDEDATPE
eukprot:scaffold106480_cov89-Phaeocystis_antarctica.AAC.2